MRTADIDPTNLECARRNVLRNGLGQRLRPAGTAPDGPLIPLDALRLDRSASPGPFPVSAPVTPPWAS